MKDKAEADLSSTRWARIDIWLTVRFPAIAAAICPLVTILLAILDHVAAASVVAGLFVVLVLLRYLPQMESFKAFGIEAKLRERLREADELLGILRRLAMASANLTYHTLGWGSRLGGHHYERKQKLSDEIDTVLSDLGAKPEEIRSLKRDYLFFCAFDLYYLFEYVVERTVFKYRNEASQELGRLSSEESGQRAQLTEKISSLQTAGNRPDVLSELSKRTFREVCHDRAIIRELPESVVQKLRELGDRLSLLVEEGERSGRVAQEARELLDAPYEDTRKKLYRELFGEEPSTIMAIEARELLSRNPVASQAK
jgi:hypothetical protein